MDDAPQKDYGHFCIVNEFYKLPGVQSYPDDEMINSMLLTNQSAMRNTPIYHVPRDGQEEAQDERRDQFYHLEIQNKKKILNNNIKNVVMIENSKLKDLLTLIMQVV